ncbi:hypothetical protein V497_08393 [Pseudogymnoascus sp. VKM F-4516 (FW-969)]|nr:hypothetical protein V497_08393 [Pseudogymnoascus sp. VKM F-4516 (FW-969)]
MKRQDGVITASSGAGGLYTNLKKSSAESDDGSRHASISAVVMERTPKLRSPGSVAGVLYVAAETATPNAAAGAGGSFADPGREFGRGGEIAA